MISLAPYEVRARFLIDWVRRTKQASNDAFGKWADAYVCRTRGNGAQLRASRFRGV